MSFFSTWARSWARNADYRTVSHAPLEVDGARLETHPAEKRLVMLQNVLSKPVLSYEDLVSTDYDSLALFMY